MPWLAYFASALPGSVMSNVFEDFLSAPDSQDLFGAPHSVRAMLRFETALARAQAALGLIPPKAVAIIEQACLPALYDLDALLRTSRPAGGLAIVLVKSLKENVARIDPDAVQWVHVGSTSQDVLDTAMALLTQEALGHIRADVRTCAQALLVLAERHAEDVLLARTLMQPASVTTFGLKCAGWAAPLVRSLQRLEVAAPAALRVQLGGAVGTQAQLQGQGMAVAALMATELGLGASEAVWHTQRDEWIALACELGLLVGSLGKLAQDIALMGQYEVGEVAEPSAPGRGGSSAMPHKRNPVACMVALSAAQRAPQHVAALLACMPQAHERALGQWQAEMAEWPALVSLTHGAVHALALALPHLQVDTVRMRANWQGLCDALPVAARDEWFNSDLAATAAHAARTQAAALSHTLRALPA